MAMTVSVNKGKKNESSIRHNFRKTELEGKSKSDLDSFYKFKGHDHIRRELTELNFDSNREDFYELYDRLFGKAVEDYNSKQKRKDRKIGKGEAIDGQLKKNSILELKIMLGYLSKSEAERKKLVAKLGGQETFEKTFLEKYKNKTEKQLKKELAFWESKESYGEAYYKQIKADNKTKTHVEFIAQLGSAEDFNKVENGQIIESLDRKDPAGKWQQAKRVLKEYMTSFQERNPNLVLIGYSIHMDEACPHVHFDVIPVAEREKTQVQGKGKRRNGLSKKVSFNGALESQGCSGNPKIYFTEWQHKESAVLAELMEKELGEKRKPGKTNSIKDVHSYKKLKALEAEKLKKLAEVDKKVSQKESAVKDLENKSQELNTRLSEGRELVKRVQVWADNKAQEVDSRENQVNSKELKLAHKEEEINSKEITLKQAEKSLESQKTEFKKKVEEEGDLTERLISLRTTVKSYSDNMTKKKEAIKAKKKRELNEELVKYRDEELAKYKRQVEANRQAYLNNVNLKYQESLKRREKALEQREEDQDQRENQFVTKIKTFVTGFQTAYISAGLKSMYGTNREVQYHVQKYLQMDRDQQKVVEKQAFSGPAGLYSKLEAFKEAVDYLFHGAPDAAELSPLKSLEGLAGEAEAEARRYNNLQNSRGRGSASPTRSIDREV